MGAIIGALAGAFAVLLFRLSQRKKDPAEKKTEQKKPVTIMTVRNAERIPPMIRYPFFFFLTGIPPQSSSRKRGSSRRFRRSAAKLTSTIHAARRTTIACTTG